MRFIGRFSGTVTYSDDTSDSFAAHLDEHGHISVNSGVHTTPNSSNQAILEVQDDNNWLETMLAMVSGTLALAPLGTSSKTVNGFVAQFSGRVANDDDTWEDFAVQYDVKAGGAFIPNSSGSGEHEVTAYNSFVAATLTAWFGNLVGDAQVTAP